MMKKLTLLAALLICFVGTTNAQFLKKLGNKINRAAEKVVERKAEQKVTKETEEAFDDVFNQEDENKKSSKDNEKRKRKTGMFGLTNIESAANYAFTHQVEMLIKSGKDEMEVDYFLPDSDDFFGTKIKDEKIKDDFITVFDAEKEAMFTYMNNDGQKIKMGVSFKTDEPSEESSIDISATGKTKVILGYNCQEYKMKGEDMTATIWVTKEVNLRFPSTLYSGKKNKSNNQEWMKDIDGWAMEMEMIDTSRRKSKTIIMKCLSIEKSSFKINSSDYKNIGQQ